MSSDERDFKLNRSAIIVEDVGETVQCLCLQHLKVHNLKVFTEKMASRGVGEGVGWIDSADVNLSVEITIPL